VIGVGCGAKITSGFVEHDVNRSGVLERLPVERDVSKFADVALRVFFDRTINHHPTRS